MKHPLFYRLFIAVALFVPMASFAAQPPAPLGEGTTNKEFVAHEVVVKWNSSVAEQSTTGKLQRTLALAGDPLLRDAHLRITKEHHKRHLAVIYSSRLSTQELIDQLSTVPTIEYVQKNVLFHTQTQTVPWGVNNSNGVKARQVHTSDGYTGAGVVVAVVDTGVDLDHSDLNNNIWNAPGGNCLVDGVSRSCPNGGWDFVGYEANGTNDNNPNDDNGHGTHVAGTIAAEDNSEGVVGVAPGAEIMPVKVLNSSGNGSYFDIITGVDFAIDNNANVINMSLGAINTGAVLKDLQNALDDAETAGISVVAAAGNYSTNAQFSPAAFDTVISVGAVQETSSGNNPDTNYSTRLAYFSNFGKNNVVAPGMRINSTTMGGSTSGDTWSGTSMASPHVAGVVALMLEKAPTLTPAKIRFILEDTATDLGDVGKDELFGAGRVDAAAAIDALDSSSNSIVLEGNWSQNSSTLYPSCGGSGIDCYGEPTVYSPIIPANGSTSTTFHIRVRTQAGSPVSGATVDLTTTAGTLSHASRTTNSSGEATFTLTASSTPGEATVTATIHGTSTASSVVATFANTLLVTDAGQPSDMGNEGWYYSRSLEAAGEYWKMSPQALAEWEDTLTSYDKVVWHTGQYSLNTDEQTNIKNYLDQGGKIFTSGGDIAYNYYYYSEGPGIGDAPTLDDDVVLSDYFKINYSKYMASDMTLVGDRHFEETGGDIEDQGSTADNFPLTDVIAHASGGNIEGYYCSNTEESLITVDSTYTSVFLGVALEYMGKTNRDEIVQNAMDYLNGTPASGGTYAASSTCDSAYNVDDGTGEDPDGGSETDGPVPGTPDDGTDSGTHPSLTDVTVDSIASTEATLAWTTDEEIISSVVYAKNNSTGETEATGSGNTASVTVDGLTPNTEYEFTVYGVYEDNTKTASSVVTDTTAPAAPQTPHLKNRGRTFISVELEDPNNTGYQFRVQIRNSDKSTVLESQTLDEGDTTAKFSGLKPGKTYFIRAQMLYTKDDGEEVRGDFSADKEQQTYTDRVKKPSVSNITATSAKIRWHKPPHAKIQQYTIQLQQKIDGKFKIVEKKIVTKKLKKKKKSAQVNNLQPNQEYKVKVRAIFKNGTKGHWSKNHQFITH